MSIARDERVRTIADAAEALDEAKPEKRAPINLSNARPGRLQDRYALLDRAVWAASGWEGDPSETADEQILGRLLAPNGGAGGPRAPGMHLPRGCLSFLLRFVADTSIRNENRSATFARRCRLAVMPGIPRA